MSPKSKFFIIIRHLHDVEQTYLNIEKCKVLCVGKATGYVLIDYVNIIKERGFHAHNHQALSRLIWMLENFNGQNVTVVVDDLELFKSKISVQKYEQLKALATIVRSEDFADDLIDSMPCRYGFDEHYDSIRT
jgi:hypothetical protein